MSRFTSGILLACTLSASLILSACSKGTSTQVVNNIVPAEVDLCLAPQTACSAGLNVSLEVGQIQVVTASAKNHVGQAVTEVFGFQSTNPTVLTIASNGTMCAGTWNSLTSPSVCTPGPTGIAVVTAVAQGVSSPPVTIYVHQHVTGVTIGRVPNQPATLSPTCFSSGAPSGPESVLYQAFAFNGSTDITSSVGPFSWQSVLNAGQSTSAVTLTSPSVGTPLNQEIASANAPGITPFFATVGSFHSQPVLFQTCPVQTISIAALGNPATSFVVNTGTSTTLNATVTDSLGLQLVGVPLTWTSSNPISVSVAGATSTIYGSVGTASAQGLGASAVTASCTPPSCNGGITPSLPVYPRTAMSFTVRSTAPPTTSTVYVTSMGCGATIAPCTTTIVPITRTSNTAPFTVGTPVPIPSTPNSMMFDSHGLIAYLGVDSSAFATQGMMTFNGTSASAVTGIAGKVLAVSPDTTLSVLSDTTDIPNQVFICTSCSLGSGNTTAAFLINGATAAAFSPDSLKAYIVAGSNLYVYSKTDALQTIPLTAPATDAAFIGNGSLGYLAGGDPAGASFLPTCEDPSLPGSLGSVNLASQLIRALPDGQSALALDPPYLQTVTATISGPAKAPVNVPGCPAPRGFLTVSNSAGPLASVGLGPFTPTQFFLSPDGSLAYILAEALPSQGSVKFSFITVYNLTTQTPSFISLAGNATPLYASLSPAGDLLFVGADDGAVHVIDTTTLADTQQVTFPFPSNPLCYGPGTPITQPPVTCLPDLVVVKP